MIRLEIIKGTDQGRIFESKSDQFIIGRSPSALLQINHSHLSGEHGMIFREQDTYIYRDLRSTNGSVLIRGNHQILLDGSNRFEAALRNGDQLLLGDLSSPVILECMIDPLQESEKNDPHIIASRTISEISSVMGKIEQSPDVISLYQAMKMIGGHLDLNEVTEAISQAVFALLPGATHLSIIMQDSTDKERYVPMLARAKKGDLPPGPIMSSRAVLRRVLQDRAGVVVANAQRELGKSESIIGGNICSTLGVPLWHRETIIGVIECDNRASSGIFKETDLEKMLVLAGHASLVIENAQLYQQLKIAKEKLQGENLYLKRQQTEISFKRIIGESPAMKKIFSQLMKVINTRATVCIFGQTGTGKEPIARAIHYQGLRKEKMFVAQNCAAMPENLLESELFGHKKGAFTGADQEKKGLFEIADGGTLFLDEIGEMPLSLQAKLLRALQEGEIRPVGATKAKSIDVRIISATNRNLEKEVEAGRFRQDLFYRLMVFPITLPPLRERREDIPDLAQHFIDRYSFEMRKSISGISQEGLNYLCSYDWPGNIRELENEIQRLIIQMDEGGIILPEHLSTHIRKMESVVGKMIPSEGTLKDMMENVERWLLMQSLKDHGNNKTQAAAALGITREGLHKKLAKYGM